MLSTGQTLGPLFVLIIIGAVLGWRDYPGSDFWPRAERLIYFLLFPALLIQSLGSADFADVPVVPIVVASVGVIVLAAAGLWLVQDRLGISRAAFTSVF